MNILTIASRELRSLFLSPLAWSILGVVQFIFAYIFLAQLNTFIQIQPQLANIENAPGATEFIAAPLFATSAIIFMLVTPLITMRVIAGERANKSLALLFSAPLSMTDIIMGKFLGVVGFLICMAVMLAIMPLSLSFSGSLDYGLFFSAWLGLVLLVTSFAAIGVYMSSLTTQPTVAAISTFGVLLMLWILDWSSDKVADANASGALEYVSMLRHFEAMSKGLFSSADFMYFILVSATFLILSIRRLDGDRLQR